MIGREDNQEEVSYKVADRRKFNADGSLKEGVTLEPAPVPVKTPEAVPTSIVPATEPENAESGDERFDEAYLDEEEGEIPGAKDPASFVNFLSSLATNAAAALGAVPHPATGKRTLDLESGKYWLDILGMLKDKTKGNLHPQEARLVDGLLGDLRMQYVQLVKATEERLKAQAAQQFSGDAILGKK